MIRDVAQPGSALRSGRRGRKFESCHPDSAIETQRRVSIFLWKIEEICGIIVA